MSTAGPPQRGREGREPSRTLAFYVTSRLAPVPGLREGSRFQPGEILASDPSFFAAKGRGDISYKTGLLVRAAITALDQTYEDSAMASARFARDTACLVTMMRPVSLNPGANLQSYARAGQAVNPDTPLAVFENVSDDADVANLLAKVGAEFDEAIAGLARNEVQSRYSGRIVEVKVYYNVDPAQMSESLRAFLKEQTELAEARKAAASGAEPGNPVLFTGPQRIDRDKAEGELFGDGVLICYYIQVEDMTGVGDKVVTGGSALKSILGKIWKEGEEPKDESGNNIDYVLSPLSVVSRMTLDCFLNLWSNSVVVGLKTSVLKILDE